MDINTLIHADIFFFVATIATALLTVILLIVLIYIVRILKDVKHVTRHVREEASLVREDIAGFRADVKREGFRVGRTVSFITSLFNFKKMSQKAKSRSKK